MDLEASPEGRRPLEECSPPSAAAGMIGRVSQIRADLPHRIRQARQGFRSRADDDLKRDPSHPPVRRLVLIALRKSSVVSDSSHRQFPKTGLGSRGLAARPDGGPGPRHEVVAGVCLAKEPAECWT